MSLSDNGVSEMVVALRFPPPQPGRRASNSGRALQTSRIGTPPPPLGHVIDEVEQSFVRPVQVLEHEHDRVLVGQPLEEPTPGCECFRPSVAAELDFVTE